MRRTRRGRRRAQGISGVADAWVDKHILGRQSSEADRDVVEDSGGDTLGYSTLSGGGAQLSIEPSGYSVPTPVPGYSQSATSLPTPLDNTPAGSPSRDSQTESTNSGNNVDQTPWTEGRANPPGSHNTWITATLDEPSSTGVTIVPLLTIRNANATSSEVDGVLPTTSTLSPADDTSTTGVSPSITSQNTTSTEISIPRVVHVDRVTQAERTGTIVGVTIGAAVVVLLVVLTILAYVRGGAMRGSFSAFRSIHKGSPRSQIVTNLLRTQETSEVLRDVERGAMSNNKRRDGQASVDRCATMKDNRKQDDVQWLEAWCRDKDEMMARQPPALQFNPELPLPPITLHDASKCS